MKVAIRVDASIQTGSGHVVRCATLASVLKQRGVEVAFVCRQLEGNYCTWLEDRGFAVLRLPAPKSDEAADERLAHARWLGVAQARDAAETREALAGLTWDWLIVDHYALDSEWERAMRSLAARIIVIDDLADRYHDADVLLDQNLVSRMCHRHLETMLPGATLLLGPEFALLQPIYAELHERARVREGQVRRILITFGGTDQENLTGRALSAILSLGRHEVEVDVVAANHSLHIDGIRSLVRGHDNVRLHPTLPTLAPLMLEADLAIGAGGATTWERLCLGLPTLVITQAANQRAIASTLSRLGLVHLLGSADNVSESDIERAVLHILNTGLDASWSKRCLGVVDGKGATRVAGLFFVEEDSALCVRRITKDDEALLLSWANDRTTRLNGFDARPISWQTHRKWFRRRVRFQVESHIYIAETIDEIPVGQVRFERGVADWEIHYAVGPIFRGKRLGRRILQLAMSKLKEEIGSVTLVGRVRKGNSPSRRVFEGLGFEPGAHSNMSDVISYERLI